MHRYIFKFFVSVFALFTLVLFSSGISSGGLQASDHDFDPKVVEFAGVINLYIAVAEAAPENPSQEEVVQLTEYGDNAARLYFDLSPEDKAVGDAMLTYLGTQVQANPDLYGKFVFLGNAFFKKADEILSRPQSPGKRSYRYTAMGGGIGLVVGGIIVFLGKFSGGSLVGGAVAVGAGLGIGFMIDSKQAPVSLPTSKVVKTAEDFKRQFPNGNSDLLKYKGAEKQAALRLTEETMAETLASLQ